MGIWHYVALSIQLLLADRSAPNCCIILIRVCTPLGLRLHMRLHRHTCISLISHRQISNRFRSERGCACPPKANESCRDSPHRNVSVCPPSPFRDAPPSHNNTNARLSAEVTLNKCSCRMHRAALRASPAFRNRDLVSRAPKLSTNNVKSRHLLPPRKSFYAY